MAECCSTVDPGAIHLCPSPRGGHIQQKSVSDQAWHMRKRGKMLSIAPGRPTICAGRLERAWPSLGCPQPVAEALLGHAKGGIVGVYDLHRHTEEGGEWLQKWADHLGTLRPTKVVPLNKQRRQFSDVQDNPRAAARRHHVYEGPKKRVDSSPLRNFRTKAFRDLGACHYPSG